MKAFHDLVLTSPKEEFAKDQGKEGFAKCVPILQKLD